MSEFVTDEAVEAAARAIQAVRATYVEDITRANQAIGDATDPDAAEALRRARTILVGISAGLGLAAARLIGEDRRRRGGVMSEEYGPRPVGCCGKCPPIVGGGYDCTCEDNPRCPVTAADRPPVTDDARAEAERRWGDRRTSDRLPMDWLDDGMASGFVLGAQWAADRAAQKAVEQ